MGTRADPAGGGIGLFARAPRRRSRVLHGPLVFPGCSQAAGVCVTVCVLCPVRRVPPGALWAEAQHAQRGPRQEPHHGARGHRALPRHGEWLSPS